MCVGAQPEEKENERNDFMIDDFICIVLVMLPY